ncbi:MAG TPA: 23S rRNA (guanosine(2251)-2'-O)-methyltransferase RlmB [Cyclobacteriaceae bacterium]
MENRKNISTKKLDVYGTRAIIESIKAGKSIEKVFIQKGMRSELSDQLFKLIRDNDISFSVVPFEKLNKITRKNHQGAIAILSPVYYADLYNVISDCYDKGNVPFILLLDRVTDVRNFGSIVRTSECAGVNAIVIPKNGAAQINQDSIKTSAGAINYIPVCKEHNLLNTIQYLKDSGLQIIGASEKSNDYVYDIDLTTPTCIVMGSEEDGISPTILKNCDYMVKLPIAGKIESLNVAVATGIITYEVIRQRGLSK